MLKRQKGFVLPIVLVFMLISHLVYMGIVHISLIQSKHTQLLKDYYQQSLQLVMVEQLITSQLENQEEELSTSLFTAIESFKQQLFVGIPLEQPIFEEQQFAIYQDDSSTEEMHLYIFTISILSNQTYPFSNEDPLLDIQYISDSDYYGNQLQKYLLNQTRPEISDYIALLEENNWQKTDYYEMTTPFQWKMAFPELSQFAFTNGWVEIYHEQQYIELISYLNNQAYPIQSNIPLKDFNCRFFGQIWQYTLPLNENPTDTVLE